VLGQPEIPAFVASVFTKWAARERERERERCDATKKKEKVKKDAEERALSEGIGQDEIMPNDV